MRRLSWIALLAVAAGSGACSNLSSSPEGAYERGQAALARNDARTARIEFLNGIKANPNDVRLRLAQAETYLALRDGASAQAEIERARALGATTAATAHLMAHALLLQSANGRAAEEALAAGPAHRGRAFWVRGLALMYAGDSQGAEAAFEEAKSAAPGDPRVWTAHALFRQNEGDKAGALKSADRALAADPADVEALILRGELTRSQYGLTAALPFFDRAVEIEPKNLTALLERAATLGELGRMSDMLADTRDALAVSANNPRALYLQSLLAARAGNFQLAQSLYQRTNGQLDGQSATMLLAGAIDYQAGNVQQAIIRLQRLVANQPENFKARRLLAAAHWRAGDAQATIDTLRPIAELDDADRYSLTLVARALAKAGRKDEAAFQLARALRAPAASSSPLSGPVTDERLGQLRAAARTSPGPQPQVRLIRALLARGLSDEALQRARQLSEGNSGVPDAHLLVGDVLALRGDFAGAAESYRRAANLAFTEPTALRLVEALDRSGQAAAAAGVLQLFLEQNPRSVPGQLLAAGAYMRARNWPAAIQIYERLRRRLGNGDALMLNNLAYAYSQRGNFERAIPIARRAWALDPLNPATADTLGWLLFKSGRKAEGLVYLARAAQGGPGEAEIRRQLAAVR